jgi:glycosyltransferase 2 family protein
LFSIGASTSSETFSFTNEFFYFAVVGYLLKFLYTLLIVYGLFFNPRGLKWLMLMVFKIPFLRRWREGANKAGSDLIVSSNELRKKSFKFWLNAFSATFFSWTARYWIVNAILLAFFGASVYGFNEHFLIYARQLVMWIMMLVSPTPGGSGFAEFVFTEYLGEFISVAGLAVAMALFWRMITYYPYLFIGVLLFPRWIRRKFGKRKHAVEATKE